MPIYQRPEWIGTNKRRIVAEVDGSSREAIFYGSVAEAKAEEAKMKLALRLQQEARSAPSQTSSSGEKTFSEFVLLGYVPFTIEHVRASTWDSRKHHVAHLLEFIHVQQGLRFSQVDTTVVGEYARWRKKPRKVMKKRKGGMVEVTIEGASGRTINNEMKTLSTMRTFAQDHPAFGPAPTFKLKHQPEVGKGRTPFWTPAQVGRLYDVCEADRQGKRLLPILVFLANTGCRKGEAIHALRTWVNEPKGMLEIAPNKYWRPKNNEPREIPISDALEPFISAPAASSKYLFVSSRTNEQGEPRPYRYFPNKTFRRLVKKAGLHGGPHMLRHSFASAFLATTPDMFLLSQILGHSHEKVTKLYTHLLPDHLAKARNAVNMAPSTGPAKREAARRWSGKAGK
jgi:integrase